MDTAKVDSRLSLKMASPRGSVAFSAFDAFRAALAFWSRLLRVLQSRDVRGFTMKAAPRWLS
jgi:hypothetical protein